MKKTNKSRLVSIDTETSGLDPIRDQLRSIQIFEGKLGTAYQGGEFSNKKLTGLLADQSVTKIIHNAVFDIPFIEHHTGIKLQNIWDTKLVEAIILGVGSQRDKNLGPLYSTSLAHTLKRRFNIDLDKSVRDSFIGETGPLTKEQIKYAIDDVRYLERLREAQIADIERLDLWEVVNLENKVVEVTANMKLLGIGFDTGTWLRISKQYEDRYKEILDELPASVNWNSPAQIKRFFGRKGIHIESLTDLADMKEDNPILTKLIELRKVYKYSTTYGQGWLIQNDDRNTVHQDLRVRPDYEQIISTGRFSCSKPNLQQLPSDTRHREAFVPKKGFDFVVGDFTGQELGIMAAASEEMSWINAMLNDDDVHSVMGQLLYGEVWDRAKDKDCTFPKKCNCSGHKKLRTNAKNLNFGLAYGKGPSALAIDLGLLPDQAAQLIKKFKSKIPNINRWLIKNGASAVRTGQTRTLPPINRFRSLELEPEEWRRRNQGFNTPVQGTGADILKLAMVYLNQYIIDNKLEAFIRIVLTVHDEIVVECKHNYSKSFLPVMKRLMEDAAQACIGYRIIKVFPEIKRNLLKN